MEFGKFVHVEELKRTRVDEPYLLTVRSQTSFYPTQGELTLDDQTFREFGITPSLGLVGRVLVLSFESKSWPADGKIYYLSMKLKE